MKRLPEVKLLKRQWFELCKHGNGYFYTSRNQKSWDAYEGDKLTVAFILFNGKRVSKEVTVTQTILKGDMLKVVLIKELSQVKQ